MAAYLIEHRQITSIETVKTFVKNCLPFYRADFECQDKNRDLLNQKVSELLGVDMESWLLEYNWVYLGHLHSLKGKFSLRGYQSEKEFEGFYAHIFLAFRIRTLLQLLIEIEEGIKTSQHLPKLKYGDNKQQHLQKLYDELRLEIESFHAYYTSMFIRSNSVPDELKKAHTKNILKQIQAFSKGFCLPISYECVGDNKLQGGHQIYLTFTLKEENKVAVRIDNLGGYLDCNKHVKTTDGQRYYPYCFTFSRGDNDTGLLKYVENLITVQLKKGFYGNTVPNPMPVEIIYGEDVNSKPKDFKVDNEQAKRYAPKKLQFAGNCVVKNSQGGLRARLSHGENELSLQSSMQGNPYRNPSALYEFFRDFEGTSLPLRGLGKDRRLLNTNLLHTSQSPFTLSPTTSTTTTRLEEKTGADFPELKHIPEKLHKEYLEWVNTEEKSDIQKAKDLYGYSPLHLAVAEGDLSKVKQLLTKKDIDMKATTKNGYSVIHLAAVYRQPEILETLLTTFGNEKDTKIREEKTKSGDTALTLIEQQELFSPTLSQHMKKMLLSSQQNLLEEVLKSVQQQFTDLAQQNQLPSELAKQFGLYIQQFPQWSKLAYEAQDKLLSSNDIPFNTETKNNKEEKQILQRSNSTLTNDKMMSSSNPSTNPSSSSTSITIKAPVTSSGLMQRIKFFEQKAQSNSNIQSKPSSSSSSTSRLNSNSSSSTKSTSSSATSRLT